MLISQSFNFPIFSGEHAHVAKQNASLADFSMTKKESQMSIIDTFIILSNSYHALCLLKIPYLIFQTYQFWDSTSNLNFPFQIALHYQKKFKKRNKTTNTLVCLPLAASAVLKASSWVCRRLDINRRTINN